MALDIPTLLLQLAVVLVASRAGGALARRLGQPSVVGDIAAGLCLAAMTSPLLDLVTVRGDVPAHPPRAAADR